MYCVTKTINSKSYHNFNNLFIKISFKYLDNNHYNFITA